MSLIVLVDTDIVIDFLRGDQQAIFHLKAESDSLCFSSITVAEIFAGVKNRKEETEVERLFSIFPVIAVTDEIAREAGRFVRLYRPSHSVEIPDALIAATCLWYNATLHKLNVEHYPMFDGLKHAYKKHNMSNSLDSSSS